MCCCSRRAAAWPVTLLPHSILPNLCTCMTQLNTVCIALGQAEALRATAFDTQNVRGCRAHSPFADGWCAGVARGDAGHAVETVAAGRGARGAANDAVGRDWLPGPRPCHGLSVRPHGAPRRGAAAHPLLPRSGMGMLGLTQLAFLASTRTARAQRMVDETQGFSWYPFAITGIQLTRCGRSAAACCLTLPQHRRTALSRTRAQLHAAAPSRAPPGRGAVRRDGRLCAGDAARCILCARA